MAAQEEARRCAGQITQHGRINELWGGGLPRLALKGQLRVILSA